MRVEIRYESFLVRVWYGAQGTATAAALVPASESDGAPEWLVAMSAGGAVALEPGEQVNQPAAVENHFHAEVEHIQTGDRRCFETMSALLDFSQGQTGCETGGFWRLDVW